MGVDRDLNVHVIKVGEAGWTAGSLALEAESPRLKYAPSRIPEIGAAGEPERM
jgi:hypothetical protein